MKTLIMLNFLLVVITMLCEAQTASKNNQVLVPDTLMVQVAGGTFQMGSDSMSNAEKPAHTVTLSSYYMDITEVTYDRWTAVRNWGLTHGYTDLPAGANGYSTSAPNQPVVELNWYDAVKWCNARSEMESFAPVYYTDSNRTEIYRTGEISLTNKSVDRSSDGYRLPTEAEWEFAAIGGNLSLGYKYSGSNIIDSVGWYCDNSNSMTHPVKSLLPNELGIYDMSANAAEWIWDRWGYFTSASQTDPQGPVTGPQRDIRGGHWGMFASDAESKYRSYGVMGQRIANIGFRTARGSVSTGVDENGYSPSHSFRLEQNYPNPFNPATTFKYQIEMNCTVSLRIYDLLGREIAALVNERKPAGTYSVTWNASLVSSGVYYYRLQAGTFAETKKLILLK